MSTVYHCTIDMLPSGSARRFVCEESDYFWDSVAGGREESKVSLAGLQGNN